MTWKARLFDDRSFDARVVYGGTQRQRRREVDVIPWNEIKDLIWW